MQAEELVLMVLVELELVGFMLTFPVITWTCCSSVSQQADQERRGMLAFRLYEPSLSLYGLVQCRR